MNGTGAPPVITALVWDTASAGIQSVHKLVCSLVGSSGNRATPKHGSTTIEGQAQSRPVADLCLRTMQQVSPERLLAAVCSGDDAGAAKPSAAGE